MTETQPAAAFTLEEADADFGMIEDATAFVRNLRRGAGDLLSKLVETLTTTQVLTYVSSDLAKVIVTNDRVEGATLRAITRLSISGDTMVCVPETADGKVDDAVWKIHTDAVDKALASRAEMIKSVVTAINLLNPLKL